MESPVPSPSSSSPIDPGGASPARLSNRENRLLNRDLEMKLQSPVLPASIPAAKVPSYAARFKSSLLNLRKISNPSFLQDGTPVVQAPESVLLQTSELWKDHVVAHFHGRRPSATKILADLNPVWGKFGSITVRTVSDSCVLIFIPSVQTREWVLQVGYWQADRCAFSVYPWTADGNLAAQELLFAPTWAVLKNVPPQLYSLDGISVVASGIGDPLHTEKSRLDPYHFGDTKVKVEIDLSKPPPEVVEVRDTQGNSVRINIEYPNLPPKCINCGKFGHLMNRCHKPPMKRAQTQRREKVVSVVKSGDEVSLLEVNKEGETEVQIETEMDKKAKVRSRSRRRSRSRKLARERALSSPPEIVNVKDLVLPVVKYSEVKTDELKTLVIKDSPVAEVSVEGWVSAEKQVVVDEVQLEEGEICEDPRGVKEQSLEANKEGPVTLSTEEEDLWFTKHSKKYRRAVRQWTTWKTQGAVGSPPKSSKLLTREISSGKEFSF